LAFFHRALADAAIFALAAALILRRAFLTGFVADFRPLTFAHRALAAAAIFRLAAALIFRRFLGTRLVGAGAPSIRLSFFSNAAIWYLILAARRNCFTDRFRIVIGWLLSHGGRVKSRLSIVLYCFSTLTFRNNEVELSWLV